MEQGVALLLIGSLHNADLEFVNSLMWLHSVCSKPSTAIE